MDINSKIIEHVNIITDREFEIKFADSTLGLTEKENYKVYIDGDEMPDFKFLSFFNRTATLRLDKSIDPEASRVEIKLVGGTDEDLSEKTYRAKYVPYYSISDVGSKSKIEVKGSSNVSEEVIKQAAEGVNKVIGRAGFLSQEMAENGCKICVVGPGESVYNIPEYRELYDESDAMTRVTIPGTIEKPIIVTTSADVMRERGSYEYAMMWDLFRLFFDMGIEGGSKDAPQGPSHDPEYFKIYDRLEEAYEAAKSEGLWHPAMMKSLKEYYVRGAMIFFEVAPESDDGSWERGIGPVNTRLELREYDRNLFKVLVEIHGEYEYISSYDDTDIMPWFVGTQPNRFGIDGKPLPKAQVTEVNLISPYQIEIKFNRQVFNAEDKEKYKVIFTPEEGESQELTDFILLPYAWDTITLQFGGWQWVGEEYKCEPGPGFVKGKIGADITGDVLSKGEYACDDLGRLNGHIKVVVMGDDIVDWSGNALGTKEYDVAFKPYFSQIKRTDEVGVYIYADEGVSRETIELCSRYVDEILSNETYGQKIADGLTYNNGGLSIIAYGKHAYMQPHLRSSYSHTGLYVEGFGGGIAQTTEANVIRDRRTTRYKDEFILGHEFGHTIELTGIRCALPELYEEIGEIYEKVIKAGLWPNSYAGSNRHEYFATLTNIWFSTMTESLDGTWNGTWGPINTREELYRYDIDGYNLMKKIYYSGEETDDEKIIHEKNFIGTPWESYRVSNIYDIDGTPYEDK